jgi:hypothetical protein
MGTVQISLPLPLLPSGWSAEKDFKGIGSLSIPTQRNLEPVGPHFLAHARRVGTAIRQVRKFGSLSAETAQAHIFRR